MKNVKPYNQADMYKTHFDMLIKFGQSEEFKKPKAPERKHKTKKAKKDLANKLILEKISQMSSELY